MAAKKSGSGKKKGAAAPKQGAKPAKSGTGKPADREPVVLGDNEMDKTALMHACIREQKNVGKLQKLADSEHKKMMQASDEKEELQAARAYKKACNDKGYLEACIVRTKEQLKWVEDHAVDDDDDDAGASPKKPLSDGGSISSDDDAKQKGATAEELRKKLSRPKLMPPMG